MAESREVLYYLWNRYPHKHELSRSRLMSMVYLADWRSALERGRQITDEQWTFGRFGPYAEHLYEILQGDDLFEIVVEQNVHGTSKGRVDVTREIETPSISDAQRPVLDYVVELTSPQRWSEMLGLVYSTFPMLVAKDRKFEVLDLPELVREYREAQPLLT